MGRESGNFWWGALVVAADSVIASRGKELFLVRASFALRVRVLSPPSRNLLKEAKFES